MQVRVTGGPVQAAEHRFPAAPPAPPCSIVAADPAPHHHLLGRTTPPSTKPRPLAPGGAATIPSRPAPRPRYVSSHQFARHVVDLLQRKYPEIYGGVHPVVRFEPMARGRGKTRGNTITLNANEYGSITMANYGTLAITLAHEMRHAKQSWVERLSHKLPITDEPHWWNRSHVELDLAAESDVYALLDGLYLYLRDSGHFER